MTIESSTYVPRPSPEGNQSKRVSKFLQLGDSMSDKVAQFGRQKPSRTSSKGIRLSQILSLALLLNLATDACQFCDNFLNPYLPTQKSTTTFFVQAQQFGGGFGGGGGRRRHFGAGGGGRGPSKKEEPKEDYYALLGVSRDANEAQIKKRFRKLAIKYHPDRQQENPEAARKKFQKIALAYETLSDADKRRAYDMGGEEAVRNQEAGGGGPGQHMDMDDLFNRFFNKRRRTGGQGKRFNFRSGGGGFGGGHGAQDPFFDEEQEQEPQKPEQEYLFLHTDVFQLNLGTISQFYHRKNVWIVLFYDGSSEAAQEFKEEYTLLAQKMYGIFSVAAVDCKEDEELCEEFSVHDNGLGNVIKIFADYTHDENGYEFRGKKEWKQIAGAASKKMQNFVHVVNMENYEDFVQVNPNKNKILFFTNKKYTIPLFKSLSKTYKEKLVFGEIRMKNDPELFKKFGISETPVILALTDPYSYSGEQYESGITKIDHLRKFLSIQAHREVKIEKKVEMHKLTYQSNKSPNSGVCGKNTPNFCLILFLSVKNSEQQYTQLLNKFKNDPVTFSYVYSREEPGLLKQFGIDGRYGAVIYKPKKSKFLKMSKEQILEKQNKSNLINPETVQSFLEAAIGGGGGKWQKLDQKQTDLYLQEVILGGSMPDEPDEPEWPSEMGDL